MGRGKHTEAEMVGAIRQVEAGRKAEEGVSKHTLYAWRAKYGGMDVSRAQETKRLREAFLFKALAEHCRHFRIVFYNQNVILWHGSIIASLSPPRENTIAILCRTRESRPSSQPRTGPSRYLATTSTANEPGFVVLRGCLPASVAGANSYSTDGRKILPVLRSRAIVLALG